jgi:hypothetical protein
VEFQTVGVLPMLVLGFVGLFLGVLWTVRFAQYAARRWPNHPARNAVAISLVVFGLFFGGWLIATLVWAVKRVIVVAVRRPEF